MGGDETERLDRLWMLVAGFLLIMTPAITLVIVYAVLIATRTVVVGQITLVQAVELYLVELLAFALFGYLLYRLTLLVVVRQSRVVDGTADETASPDASGVEAPEER